MFDRPYFLRSPPGPDYYIPSNRSVMTADEVFSYTSLIAIFRSSWWPSGPA